MGSEMCIRDRSLVVIRPRLLDFDAWPCHYVHVQMRVDTGVAHMAPQGTPAILCTHNVSRMVFTFCGYTFFGSLKHVPTNETRPCCFVGTHRFSCTHHFVNFRAYPQFGPLYLWIEFGSCLAYGIAYYRCFPRCGYRVGVFNCGCNLIHVQNGLHTIVTDNLAYPQIALPSCG